MGNVLMPTMTLKNDEAERRRGPRSLKSQARPLAHVWSAIRVDECLGDFVLIESPRLRLHPSMADSWCRTRLIFCDRQRTHLLLSQ